MCKKSLPQLFFNFLICFLLASTAFAQNDYWRAVYLDCQNRPGVSQNIYEKISNYSIMSDVHSRDMAQYLTFLYAYMPQSDLADYDFEFFKDQVIRRFVESYECGATPNPCIVCNRLVKFGRLMILSRLELFLNAYFIRKNGSTFNTLMIAVGSAH